MFFLNVADLHSITVPQEPKLLRERILDLMAIFLASGLEPDKSTLFVQSHVPQHAELSWVLSCMSYMGQLSRMTQFKEKSQKSEEKFKCWFVFLSRINGCRYFIISNRFSSCWC